MVLLSVTLADIAQRANVSIATVSRTLNRRDGLISEETRKRIHALAEEMGYRPNHAARALVTGRTNLVAFCSPGIRHSFSMAVAHQVQQALANYDLDMITRQYYFTYVAGKAGIREEWSDAATWPVDGIIQYCGLFRVEADDAKTDVLQRPLVNIGIPIPGYGDWVSIELYPAAQAAVRHLISLGCEKIAFLGPLPTGDRVPGRREAYEDVLREAGLEPAYINFEADARDLRAVARETVQDYLRSAGCPDGLFCSNDELAVGACRGLWDSGLRIPEDVAVMGCDGISDTEYLQTPLTTIVQPVEEAARLACEFLQRRLQEPGLPEQSATLQARLVTRASTAR